MPGVNDICALSPIMCMRVDGYHWVLVGDPGEIIAPRALGRVKSPWFWDTVNRGSIFPFSGDKSGRALWKMDKLIGKIGLGAKSFPGLMAG